MPEEQQEVDNNKPASTMRKKAKKTPAASPAKAAKKEKAVDDNTVRLSDICKELKMETTRARRILRATDGLEDPGSRWAWEKGSGQLSKVRKALEAADAK